jgi:hypothetical protein
MSPPRRSAEWADRFIVALSATLHAQTAHAPDLNGRGRRVRDPGVS